MEEYRVKLDIFNGPIDLLLYLIKRDELDIYDIPIHRITESYLGYLEQLRTMSREHGLDINIAGDFLVMAATLMEIKSATLLPQDEEKAPKDGQTTAAQDLADPRYELVQQLLEYKRLKDSANLLEAQQASHFGRFPRVPVALEGDNEPPPLDMDEVQIWDLLECFQRVMKDISTRLPKYHEVVYDETPIGAHAAIIQDRLKLEKRLSLRDLLTDKKNKSEMIGVFLALLELIREKQILVKQEEATDDMEIIEAPEEHKKTYVGASLELSNVDAVEEKPSESSITGDTSSKPVEETGESS